MTELRTTTTCTLWANYDNGTTSTTIPNAPLLSPTDSYECIRWQQVYNSTGVLTIGVNTSLPVNLTGTNNNINLNTVNNGLYPLPVKFNDPQLVQLTQTGTNTVQLDADFYPIPVVNQGTAPTEVYLMSGATIQLDENSQVTFSTESVQTLAQIALLVFVLSMIASAFVTSTKYLFNFLRKKTW